MKRLALVLAGSLALITAAIAAAAHDLRHTGNDTSGDD